MNGVLTNPKKLTLKIGKSYLAELFRQIKRSAGKLFSQIKRSVAELFRQIKHSVAEHLEKNTLRGEVYYVVVFIEILRSSYS